MLLCVWVCVFVGYREQYSKKMALLHQTWGTNTKRNLPCGVHRRIENINVPHRSMYCSCVCVLVCVCVCPCVYVCVCVCVCVCDWWGCMHGNVMLHQIDLINSHPSPPSSNCNIMEGQWHKSIVCMHHKSTISQTTLYTVQFSTSIVLFVLQYNKSLYMYIAHLILCAWV